VGTALGPPPHGRHERIFPDDRSYLRHAGLSWPVARSRRLNSTCSRHGCLGAQFGQYIFTASHIAGEATEVSPSSPYPIQLAESI
jgi:hypothetical protein